MSDQENCYQIEAIVSFDDRGQLVLPKDLRKKFNLKAGDKFALISCMTSKDGEACCTPADKNTLCCFTLVHTSQMAGVVTQTLGPIMSNMLKD